MAIDCSDVPSTVTLDCANPWGVNCTSKAKFQFTSLWHITRNIQSACANDTRLFLPKGGFASAQNASLTQESCTAIAGSSWTYYPTADIWNRLTTWKFPLLQLVASFPRPPLNFTVEFFVILHLLGDPVDTIKNLIFKMSTCQHTAAFWKKECEILLTNSAEDSSHRTREDTDREWKALAIITDAYGEWDKGGLAQSVLHKALDNVRTNSEAKNDLMKAARQTGRALAADRGTKFLPIIVAQIFFIGSIGIAIFRTAAAARQSATSDSVFINVEAHSIAFSAQYLWIIPAVFLSSIIGVSQTEAAIPRILRRFQVDLDRLDLPEKVSMPNDGLKDFKDDQVRIFQGGIYSWQPSKWQRSSTSPSKSYRSTRQLSTVASSYEPLDHDLAASRAISVPAVEPSSIAEVPHQRPSDNRYALLPFPILILGTVTGMIVSSLVPPDGFNCRHIGEILICAAWILSAQADFLLNYLWPLSSNKLSTLFWMTAAKDFLITVATMGGVVLTQVGVFNRCSCFTRWGRTGLALPERPDIAQTLFRRLNMDYPAITFTGIGIELVVVPLYLCIRYHDAIRVFIQRDDRQSNAIWLWEGYHKSQDLVKRFQSVLSSLRFSRSTPRRTGTSAVERGLAGDSQELQTLSRTISEEPENISADGAGLGQAIYQATVPIASNYQSESSSVQRPLPSGTDSPSSPEPRRRNTEPPWDTGDDAPLVQRSQDDKLPRRKPVPTASPLQRA